jgi:hypothetical protein
MRLTFDGERGVLQSTPPCSFGAVVPTDAWKR